MDTPVIGARNREERAHFALPPGVDFPHLRGLKAATSAPAQDTTGVASIFSSLLSPDLTWKDVVWLQSFAKVPLLLKGVLNPDDADRAVKEGVAGVIVSNHGGRYRVGEPRKFRNRCLPYRELAYAGGTVVHWYE